MEKKEKTGTQYLNILWILIYDYPLKWSQDTRTDVNNNIKKKTL